MKKLYLLCPSLIATIFIFTVFTKNLRANETKELGTVQKLEITSESIAKNLVGENNVKVVQVYLPPNYEKNKDKNYPVVYFLTGFGDLTFHWFNKSYDNLSISESMDALINTGTSKDIIIAVVSGKNIYGGSFYSNSPITGNWEDFVVKEVVEKIDLNFRTIKSKNSRGIAGHSMGAHGALEIAMKYPEIFSSVYALSPGMFDENGLEDFLFDNNGTKNEIINRKNEFEKLNGTKLESARASLLGAVRKNSWTNMKYVYGFAYSGNAKAKTYLDIPYSKVGEDIKENENLDKWENGFGNIKGKLADYNAKDKKLKAIGIEVGERDEFPWLVRGCDYLNNEMAKMGIDSFYIKFDGMHQDKVKSRFENYLIPFFNENLEF